MGQDAQGTPTAVHTQGPATGPQKGHCVGDAVMHID
jgi:hypothetical protein